MLVVLALGTPAVAQVTEKEAVKQVEATSKVQLKAFKQNAAAALATLDASLKGLEATLPEDAEAAEVCAIVGSAASEFLATLNDAADDAKAVVDFAAKDAMNAIADGADLEGLYPEALYYGGGGVLDKHRAAVTKAGAKSRDAAVKRLAKTATKLEKVASIALGFELRFPTRPNAIAITQGGLGGLAHTATLDLIVSASDLDLQDDGALFLAGQAGFESDVELNFSTTGVDDSIDATPSPGTLRIQALFQSLPENGYVVGCRQGDDGAQGDTGEIGVR
jgi:hypothetical protein